VYDADLHLWNPQILTEAIFDLMRYSNVTVDGGSLNPLLQPTPPT
jgi:hypothetical protein